MRPGGEPFALSALTLLGILLIVIGAILILIPIALKSGVRLENVHPLLLVWKKLDGLYIGTSPILIIILVLLYIFLILRR